MHCRGANETLEHDSICALTTLSPVSLLDDAFRGMANVRFMHLQYRVSDHEAPLESRSGERWPFGLTRHAHVEAIKPTKRFIVE